MRLLFGYCRRHRRPTNRPILLLLFFVFKRTFLHTKTQSQSNVVGAVVEVTQYFQFLFRSRSMLCRSCRIVVIAVGVCSIWLTY